MTHTVVNRLAEKYPGIRKGVNAVVGGNIIEFEALRIKREALREGLHEGLEKGMQEGMQKGMQEGKMTTLFESVQDGDIMPERAAKRAGQDLTVFIANMRNAGYTVPDVGTSIASYQ